MAQIFTKSKIYDIIIIEKVERDLSKIKSKMKSNGGSAAEREG
jgi:hypothetical protein